MYVNRLGCLAPVFADTTAVSTEDQLISAVNAGGEITLAGDIVTVRNGVTVILNLGGYSITSNLYADNGNGINAVNNNGTLTVNDGTFSGDSKAIESYYNTATVITGGTFTGDVEYCTITLTSITIDVPEMNLIGTVNRSSGTVTIAGNSVVNVSQIIARALPTT